MISGFLGKGLFLSAPCPSIAGVKGFPAGLGPGITGLSLEFTGLGPVFTGLRLVGSCCGPVRAASGLAARRAVDGGNKKGGVLQLQWLRHAAVGNGRPARGEGAARRGLPLIGAGREAAAPGVRGVAPDAAAWAFGGGASAACACGAGHARSSPADSLRICRRNRCTR